LPGEGVGGAAARAGSGGTPGAASACGTSAAGWPTGWVHPPAGCLRLGRLHWVWDMGRSVAGFGCVVIWMLVPDCGFKRRRGFAGVPTIRTAHENAAVFRREGLPRAPWAPGIGRRGAAVLELPDVGILVPPGVPLRARAAPGRGMQGGGRRQMVELRARFHTNHSLTLTLIHAHPCLQTSTNDGVGEECVHRPESA